MRSLNIMRWIPVAAMLGALAGCQGHGPQPTMNDGFSDNFFEESAVRRLMVAQSAAGARADGMLYPIHFDGRSLNSLGRDKLDLMLKSNDQEFPVKVYLSVPEDARVEGRKAAVLAYLKDRGLHEDQIQTEVGSNPDVSSPVAPNLIRLNKTEDVSGFGGTGPVDTPHGAAPSGGATGGSTGPGGPSDAK